MKKTVKIQVKKETRTSSASQNLNGQVKKSSFPLVPLGDRLVVKEAKAGQDKKTDSGIYIPDNVKDDKGTKRGEVLAIGEGRFEDGKLVPMNVKVGDIVLFQWGDQVTYQGEDYFIIRESEVSAIVK
jgi:chaperonin GroES